MARIPDKYGELFQRKAFVHRAKYPGEDKYPCRRPGEVRVIYKILPERVQGL